MEHSELSCLYSLLSGESFIPAHKVNVCLCGTYRYFTAEGVRIYSQETWSIVTAGQGRQLVEQNIDAVVPVSLTIEMPQLICDIVLTMF